MYTWPGHNFKLCFSKMIITCLPIWPNAPCFPGGAVATRRVAANLFNCVPGANDLEAVLELSESETEMPCYL